MNEYKDKHVNIRITKTVHKQIENIKKEMEKEQGMVFSRSQVMFMLIVRGIQKYIEDKLYPNEHP
jgi:hypothetical protein